MWFLLLDKNHLVCYRNPQTHEQNFATYLRLAEVAPIVSIMKIKKKIDKPTPGSQPINFQLHNLSPNYLIRRQLQSVVDSRTIPNNCVLVLMPNYKGPRGRFSQIPTVVNLAQISVSFAVQRLILSLPTEVHGPVATSSQLRVTIFTRQTNLIN